MCPAISSLNGHLIQQRGDKFQFGHRVRLLNQELKLFLVYTMIFLQKMQRTFLSYSSENGMIGKNRRRRFLSYAGGKETKHSTICVEIWKIKLFVNYCGTIYDGSREKVPALRQHHPRRGRARRAAPPPDRGGAQSPPPAPSRRSSARSEDAQRARREEGPSGPAGERRRVPQKQRGSKASGDAGRHPRGYLRAAVVF